MAQKVTNLPAMWDTWVQSLGWENLLEKGIATHSSILAWRIPWKGVKIWGFPGSSDGKESPCKAGDLGSIPGLGRYPEEWNGKPLQYACLVNRMERGAWWAIVH